ncbi:spore coat protein CotJB [Xylanibacillus composti]|uniref:Spore coat protein CotJB n=1 Tax=Xylanibacillus composti TaxID=1572762 RepID=A0A8J4H6X4_9BACL|nr:spore coat protein CotJB [Xylanibacillus composti]GIQ69878.1 spore coat protein CotJB [Xylanibacillus composti]
MDKQMDAAYYHLLHELQAVDFVLVELNLYLDTHPNDLKAIEEYNRYAVKRKELACAYEEKYGPLMHFGHSYSKYPWQWADEPWPWQV